jgi:hypothetical protein
MPCVSSHTAVTSIHKSLTHIPGNPAAGYNGLTAGYKSLTAGYKSLTAGYKSLTAGYNGLTAGCKERRRNI